MNWQSSEKEMGRVIVDCRSFSRYNVWCIVTGQTTGNQRMTKRRPIAGSDSSSTSIEGFAGSLVGNEPALNAASVSQPGGARTRSQDAPSAGSDLGDDAPHEIVMGGGATASGGAAYDAGEFQGISAKSFALPGLHSTTDAPDVVPDGSFSVASVVGTDDRRQIGDTRQYPFRAICALLMTGANGKQPIGTGWFAGPNLIVTAGHNLFDNEAIGPGSGWIQQVQVWPGRNGNSTWETEIADPTQLGVSSPWLNRTADRDLLDYGVIRLKNGLGNKVGWFGLKYWPSDQLQGKEFNVVGYPAAQTGIASWTMWYDIGSITQARQKTLEYTMDTTPGESGSPVVAWVKDRTAQGSMIVVGIHNYGMGTFNQATRITPAVLDSISQLAS